MTRHKLNKMGYERDNTNYYFDKSALTYGEYWLPPYGAIQNRDLNFPNARLNEPTKPLISVKNIINPRFTVNENSFGKIWYPNMFIDLNYNPKTGGYVNSNGPIGPYFAQGLGNYPRSMFKEVYFGKNKNKVKNADNKIIFCLPKEQKFPVNTKKKCSAALSYARYSPDPCKIARCVQRNCKKYPTVGSKSKLIEECKKKKKKSPKK